MAHDKEKSFTLRDGTERKREIYRNLPSVHMYWVKSSRSLEHLFCVFCQSSSSVKLLSGVGYVQLFSQIVETTRCFMRLERERVMGHRFTLSLFIWVQKMLKERRHITSSALNRTTVKITVQLLQNMHPRRSDNQVHCRLHWNSTHTSALWFF